MGKKKKESMGLLAAVILWAVTYTVVVVGIFFRVDCEYKFLLGENSVRQSVNNYKIGIIVMIVIISLLSVFLWLIACNETKIRRVFEENTIVFTMVFLLVAFIVIHSVTKRCVLVDDLGNERNTLYSWIIFFAAVFNWMLGSPNSVKQVVFIGGNTGRYVAAVTAFLLAAIIYIVGWSI